MISFFVAFGLEALLYNNKLWAKLSVGLVLAGVVLLVCWCVLTRVDFSLLGRLQGLKDGLVGFIRSLRGKASEPGPDAGDGGGGDDHGESGVLSRSEVFTKPFDRLQWRRRSRASTAPSLGGPPDATGMEMNEVNDKASRSAV